MTDHNDGELDRDLGNYLRESIPTPKAGYWEAIDARLSAATEPSDEGHVTSLDTRRAVGRPMAMNTTTSTSKTNPLLWAAAAAMVVLAGIGAFVFFGGDDTELRELEVAAAPQETDAASVDAAPVDAAPVDVEPVNAGPLSTIRTRIEDVPGDADAVFCFAGEGVRVVPIEDPIVGAGIAELVVLPSGRFNLTLFQNRQFAAVASGGGDASGEYEISPLNLVGFGGALPPYLIEITDTTISFGDDATLPIVMCDGVQGELDLIDELVAQAQADSIAGAGGPAVPIELAPIDDKEILSSAGLGPIRIGMLVSELEVELGVDLDLITIDLAVAGECGMIQSTVDRDVSVLVELVSPEDAVIRRVEVFSDRWQTPSGIRVGMSEQQVLDTFPGQIDAQPHVYAEDGQYLTFVPNDANDPNTVEFVTEFGEVVQIRAGDRSWVSLVEGCA